MPNLPHGDRIRELEKSVASQGTQQGFISKSVGELNKAREELASKVEDARRETERELAVLREKVARLETGHGKLGDRLWSVIPPLVAVVIAFLLGRLTAPDNSTVPKAVQQPGPGSVP